MIEHNPIPIHSYEKWNGMVHIYIPLNPKFNIGDICEITSEGQRYPSYDQMAKAFSNEFNLIYDDWRGNCATLLEEIGKKLDEVEILAYATHENREKIVYAVRPTYTHKWIMIGEEGLELIKHKPFFKETDFMI